MRCNVTKTEEISTQESTFITNERGKKNKKHSNLLPTLLMFYDGFLYKIKNEFENELVFISIFVIASMNI
jgi:hypothetical protein